MAVTKLTYCPGKRVPITAILQDNHLLGEIKRIGDRLVGCCPIHGGDNPHAFVVTISKNLWYCFTGCQKGGDSVELVQCLLGKSYRSALNYLNSLAVNPFVRLINDDFPSPPCSSAFVPFTRSLPLEGTHPFIQKKGISMDTATFFDSGFYAYKGFLKNCVGVRLHDPGGQPLGYIGRRLEPSEILQYGKWKFPKGFPKNQMLFNYHRVLSQLRRGLVVVECPWGVMRLNCLNAPSVSLLGTSASSEQIEMLSKASQIICMLDGDAAGRAGAVKLRHQVGDKVPFYTVDLPENQDVDDLTDFELRCLLTPFFL